MVTKASVKLPTRSPGKLSSFLLYKAQIRLSKCFDNDNVQLHAFEAMRGGGGGGTARGQHSVQAHVFPDEYLLLPFEKWNAAGCAITLKMLSLPSKSISAKPTVGEKVFCPRALNVTLNDT